MQAFWNQSFDRGGWGRGLALVLTPFAWIYGRVARIRRSLFQKGVFKQRRLSLPVISVGGLRVGGSGKTPFALWLAQRLTEKGYRVVILTRGYGRKRKRGTQILTNSNLEKWNAEDCGDEPYLLAASLPDVPVAVNADRFQAGRAALKTFPVDVFLLDDGFQHLRLARDLDLVLVPEEDSSRTTCLPKGPLRETFAALNHANILVRMADSGRDPTAGSDSERSRACMKRDIPIFSARFEAEGFFTVDGNHRVDPGQGSRVLAFCGIARPFSFWKTVEESGLKIHHRIHFPDHHPYSDKDHQAILQLLPEVDWAVTTEKDAGKIVRFGWPTGKVRFLRRRLVMENESAFWEKMELAGLQKV